jgi:hypothetical protein
MTATTETPSVVDYRLAYRLSRKHDIAFLKSLAKTGDMEQVLISNDVKSWLSDNQCKAIDIISKLHVLMEVDKNERKRHFGFQFRNNALAFQIVYIDRPKRSACRLFAT